MPQEILNYRIEREIGEGGMSRVYKGIDSKTGQQVAIKELLPHLSHHKEVRQRFRREAQVMAILNHPHIVRLLRYEEVGDNLYLVQEYVDGMNLAQYIGEHRGAIPETDAIRLFRQLLEALSYAHKAGVVHRDIKPSNILLTLTGDVKILDFGIARIVGDESGGFRTKTGTRIGTVAYMSPEQVNAKADIDHRSDIYSAGVLFHHMLTGRAPYDMGTDSEFEVQMKIVKEPLPRMREVNPGVSEKMQRIVDKATAKNRDVRYQSCGEFLQALKKHVELDQIPDKSLHPKSSDTESNPVPKPIWKKVVAPVIVIASLLFGIMVNQVVMSGGEDSAIEDSMPVVENAVPAEAPAAEDAPADEAATATEDIPEEAAETSSESSDSRSPLQIVNDKLQYFINLNRPEGYQETHTIKTGALKDGVSEGFNVELDGGKTYKIISKADSDCKDLDMIIYDENGNEVAKDILDDDTPIINIIPATTAQFSVKVIMRSCTSDPCYYGILILGRVI